MGKLINKIVQFAVITENADETVKIIREALNLGTVKVWDFRFPALFDTTILDKPEPWSMKLALGWIGDMQFEVIEPTGGDTLYKEYLHRWGHAGVQHLLTDRGSVSYQEMKRRLSEAGMPIVNEAKSNVAIKLGPFTLPPLPRFLARSMSTIFGYTGTLGTLKMAIEISQYPPGIRPRQGVRMGVPSYWSEGDRKNFELLTEDSLIVGIEGFIVLTKNINETKPYYEKLFGTPSVATHTEFVYELETNFLEVMQPNICSPYEKILQNQGEGIQILSAIPRYKSKQQNNEAFAQKGFEAIQLDSSHTLFTHNKMPFHIEIDTRNLA